jgi:hypothetical protein
LVEIGSKFSEGRLLQKWLPERTLFKRYVGERKGEEIEGKSAV